jgi:hypothetical protein
MASSAREQLDELDLNNLTLNEIRGLRNDVLRRVLLDALNLSLAPPEHHSHATHSNHYQSVALENPLDVVTDPQVRRDAGT